MNTNSNFGSRCGTNIDHDRLDFTAAKSNLVYLDKVFSYNKDQSCPILLALETSPESYTAILTVNDSCGCNCNNCDVDCSSTFTVTNAFVLAEQFLLNGDINPEDVTVNGIPVDSISTENGQYVASTAGLISQIQRRCCFENGLPTKAFFLASNIGPWAIRLRIVLEGVVSTGGRNCCFRAEFVNNNGTFAPLPANADSNFAIPKLSLPCAINGVAPTIRFQFGAVAQILNPILTLDTSDGNGTCTAIASNLILSGTLVINPTISVEVVRKSLFCVTACEAMLPCDGTEEALAAAQADDGDDDSDPFDPDCACGTCEQQNAGCGTCEQQNAGCGTCGSSSANTIITRPAASGGGNSRNSCSSCMTL